MFKITKCLNQTNLHIPKRFSKCAIKINASTTVTKESHLTVLPQTIYRNRNSRILFAMRNAQPEISSYQINNRFVITTSYLNYTYKLFPKMPSFLKRRNQRLQTTPGTQACYRILSHFHIIYCEFI